MAEPGMEESTIVSRKTCFITGANSGIGKAAAIQLARAGFRVAIGCRNLLRGQEALEEVQAASSDGDAILITIDMSSMASIRGASEKLTGLFDTLDLLIHNAADFDISRKTALSSADGIESIWATNHVGVVLLTDLLLDSVRKSYQGRIITIASQGLMLHPGLKVNLNDPEFKKRPYTVAGAYYQSKLAQLMYSFWLARKLEGTGITVNCIRVTNVKIDIKRYPDLSNIMKFMYSIKSRFSISSDEMARSYTWAATSSKLNSVSGRYFDEKNTEVKSSAYSRREEEIRKLMELTYEYLK